ncbi:aldo/keto reductase [Anaerosacchariphilus polymeriproducens]|uniref:Aldo/keto reductase n=1 Tax=Anaerosacchariphilus polymeriproducens TaxID=1812858 RepID=A0A371AZI4_9FIRM|nr:aldo/keto reductase [Anaerosacchariphilus polymeriproducens]RDU24890.1 aldo/keto reductase [Anaerosacchariphilus polymeriproducens]
MKKLKLNNGVEIPQLGLGVFRTEVGEQTENAVKWALKAGYRHIDAAKIYNNEKSVGKAIRESGVKREDIFVTTKLWNDDIIQRRTKEAFYESLEALQMDYVDLYLIHWPVEGSDEAWHEMEMLYLAGKIRAIGISNFHKQNIERLEKAASIIPAVNQIESHPLLNNQKLIDFCKAKGIQVQVWSPLGGTGSNLLQNEILTQMATKYDKTPAQIVIRWNIQRDVIVIPKSAHENRIISNKDVFDFELEQEDMSIIHEMDKNFRVGPNPDDYNFK